MLKHALTCIGTQRIGLEDGDLETLVLQDWTKSATMRAISNDCYLRNNLVQSLFHRLSGTFSNGSDRH